MVAATQTKLNATVDVASICPATPVNFNTDFEEASALSWFAPNGTVINEAANFEEVTPLQIG